MHEIPPKLDDTQLQSAIGDALLRALTPDAKDALVQRALTKLLDVPKKASANGMSTLDKIVSNALHARTKEIVIERLRTDEALKDTINGLITEGVKRILEAGREKFIAEVAESLTNTLNRSAYDD